MSYAQEIKIKCSEVAPVKTVNISPTELGFDVEVVIDVEGKAMTQEMYFSSELWDDLGEIGIAEQAAKVLALELEFWKESQ